MPFEIDELLRGLDDYMGAIEPANAAGLIENLAECSRARAPSSTT